MVTPSTFKETLLDLVPSLRAFAFCLRQNRAEADDLVYRSLYEIWSSHRFGKYMELKEAAFTVIDRRCRFAPPTRSEDHPAKRARSEEPNAFDAAFEALDRTEREALSLVTVWGFTDDQAARICGIGTQALNRRIIDGSSRLALACHYRSRADKLRHKRYEEDCHG
jgi:RNA polymerase sigma-70 factor (ECF subfamily)